MEAFDAHMDRAAAAQIRSAARRGALTHALLFTGSGDRLAAAQFAAAAMECTASDAKPCGQCEECRRVRQGIHPDVITVADPEHKLLSAEVVRNARADAHIVPNQGRRKVYIFPDCAILTELDQNILLKTVEDGPEYAAFLFCSENPASVLATLRSRCIELRLRPAGAEEGDLSETARAVCRALAGGKRGEVAAALLRQEKKFTREDVQALAEELYAVMTAALLGAYGYRETENGGEMAAFLGKSLTKAQLMRTIELLQNDRQQCLYNVNAGLVLGAMAVELEGIF